MKNKWQYINVLTVTHEFQPISNTCEIIMFKKTRSPKYVVTIIEIGTATAVFGKTQRNQNCSLNCGSFFVRYVHLKCQYHAMQMTCPTLVITKIEPAGSGGHGELTNDCR